MADKIIAHAWSIEQTAKELSKELSTVLFVGRITRQKGIIHLD